MSDIEAELREQLTDTFRQPAYPVNDSIELVSVLSYGPATEFQAGDVVIPAIELGTKYGDVQDFPYQSVELLVDDINSSPKAEGVIKEC